MDNLHLFNQINSLPKHLKQEVSDFIEFLKQKSQKQKKIKERKFGYAKGSFKMAPDFDEPITLK